MEFMITVFTVAVLGGARVVMPPPPPPPPRFFSFSHICL